MILRRIGNAVKNQDWFVVFFEIAIVVIGVYIGIYLGEIAQKRELDDNVNKALIALKEDINSDLERLDEILVIQEELGQNYEAAISALAQSPPDEATFAGEYSAFSSGNDTLFPNTSAYETMKTAGYLQALKEEHLRLLLVRLFEREYVRQTLNAGYLDEMRTQLFLYFFDTHWNHAANRLMEPKGENAIILSNAIFHVQRQWKVYKDLLTDLVQPRMVESVKMIDDYLERYDGDDQ